MKQNPKYHVIAFVLASGLLLNATAQAFISGINSPVNSVASINFDDTNSVPTGSFYPGPFVNPWNGSSQLFPVTTDPNGDSATGSIVGSFVPSSNIYALNFNSINLTQAAVNTGYATLIFNFDIQFQLDALGLPAQAPLYPNFLVNGTVQTGGFASVTGFINYSGEAADGTSIPLTTVTYNNVWNTAGPFSGTATGVPVPATAPALGANSILELNGSIQFEVDPATINAQSVAAPEPGSVALLALGFGTFVMRRRRE